MMMYKPTLILKRLVIQKSGKLAYDEVFHEGVNIIRGTNGSGKSTIVESIFYVLGGDIPIKKEEFSGCDFVYGEFEMNEIIFTLKRAIEDGRPAIDIFEGSYNQAISNVEKWNRYSNTRSDIKKSYSQILFSFLGIPENKTLEGQNITMHAILRLILEDQNTEFGKIFLKQDYPEKNITRQAISDLLLGIDDSELLSLKLQLNNNEKDFSSYDGQLKKITTVLHDANMDINEISLSAEKKEIEYKLEQIKNKIKNLYTDNNSMRKQDANEKFTQIKSKISEIKQKIFIIDQKIESLLFEVDDSCNFIISLKAKLDALSASTKISESLGMIKFEYCPSCLQALEDNIDHAKCGLCKSEIKKTGSSSGHLKMRNEIEFQKQESERIIERKNKRIQEFKSELRLLDNELKVLEHQSQTFINAVNPIEAAVMTSLEKSGYLQFALEDVAKRKELADRVFDISAKKAELNLIISELKDKIYAAEYSREERKREIYSDINDTAISLIKNDPIQELQNIDRISFDFAKDEILAIGKASPAASTGSYLKNAFFFSLFLVSLKHETVRYPRFTIMDNIEDKAVQDNRVQQFHKDIIKHSDESNVKHQIIFTARSDVVTDELEKSGLCIGENYDGKKGKHSLDFAQKTEQN